MDNVIYTSPFLENGRRSLRTLPGYTQWKEGWTVSFRDLMRRAIKEKPNQA